MRKHYLVRDCRYCRNSREVFGQINGLKDPCHKCVPPPNRLERYFDVAKELLILCLVGICLLCVVAIRPFKKIKFW